MSATGDPLAIVNVADDWAQCRKSGCPTLTRYVLHLRTINRATDAIGERDLRLCPSHIAALLEELDFAPDAISGATPIPRRA